MRFLHNRRRLDRRRHLAASQEPRRRGGIACHLSQEQRNFLVHSAVVEVDAVIIDIAAVPTESIIRARRTVAVRPEIRAPGNPGRVHGTTRRIVIERRIAVDLALDHPLNGPAHIMVPGLDRASRDCDPVTIIRKCVGVAFRRDVDDLEIGEMRFRRSNRLLNIALADASVVGKGLIFGRRGHP